MNVYIIRTTHPMESLNVDELKERLRRSGLSTQGRKADLIARLSAVAEEQTSRATEQAAIGLPRDVLRNISRFTHQGQFYFNQRFKESYNIADKYTIDENFLPASVEVFTDNTSVKTDAIRNKQQIYDAIPENFNRIILEKEHLKVIITKVIDVHGNFRIHSMIFKPHTGHREAIYQLEVWSPTPFIHGAKKKQVFHFIKFTRMHPGDAEVALADTMIALGDLLLGIQWVQTYVLHGRGQLIKGLDPEVRFASHRMDHLVIHQQDQQLIKTALLKKLKKIMP